MLDNSNGLLLPIHQSHCVRRLNVTSAVVTEYAGKCGTVGNTLAGHRLTYLKINSPFGVASDNFTTVFVSIWPTQPTVISISTEDDMVKDVITINYWPRKLNFDPLDNSLYLTVNNGLGVITLDDLQFTLIAGSTASGSAGSNEPIPLSDSSYSNPGDFFRLGENRWLVADSWAHRCGCVIEHLVFCHSPVDFCAHSHAYLRSMPRTPAHFRSLLHVLMHEYRWENEKSGIF